MEAPATTIVCSTPELECLNKNGRKQYWQGYGIKREDGYFYYTATWQQLAGGGSSAQTASVPSRVGGKNVGRSNETTDQEQLIFEVSVLERKKREEGYHEAGVEPILEFDLPMLAHTYFDTETIVDGVKTIKKGHAAKIKFPCYAQPKLDGFRCEMDTRADRAWSRKGKLWKPEVMSHLIFDGNGAQLDGELMLPLEMPFEKLKTAVSNRVAGLTEHLGYHVYDCRPDGVNIHANTPFCERWTYLKYMFRSAKLAGVMPENVYLVSTVICESPEHAEKLLRKAIKMGYEGLMLRNADGLYVCKHRSYDLQKLKFFMDSEFKIIDVIDGRGSDEGAIMYVCVTEGGEEFTVRPKGTIPSRMRLWEQYQNGSYDPVGKLLTVKYFELSEKGVPRFPSGLAVRDYE